MAFDSEPVFFLSLEVNDEEFEKILLEVEAAVSADSKGQHVSAIVGKPTGPVKRSRARNLAAVGAATTVETKWLTPAILSGLCAMTAVAFLLIYAFLQTFYIQTPVLYVEKSIDFGRIEK